MRNSKSGLVLTEALLAVAMMAVAVLVLGSIIDGVIRTVAISKEHLIAENLATEAIEAVKNLRDTNWLQNPDDPSCFMRRDPALSCDEKVTAEKSYVVQKNDDGEWSLQKEASVELDLKEGAIGDYRLYVKDVGGVFDGYVHDSGAPSQFYRGITFTLVSEAVVAFRVRVQWYEGAKVRGIEREMTLYNY